MEVTDWESLVKLSVKFMFPRVSWRSEARCALLSTGRSCLIQCFHRLCLEGWEVSCKACWERLTGALPQQMPAICSHLKSERYEISQHGQFSVEKPEGALSTAFARVANAVKFTFPNHVFLQQIKHPGLPPSQ